MLVVRLMSRSSVVKYIMFLHVLIGKYLFFQPSVSNMVLCIFSEVSMSFNA